jgi:hypothetical protein
MRKEHSVIIFGKPVRDYVEFSKVFLALILLTGITRLALSLAGVPNSTAKWLSMSVLVWIAAFFYSIRVHTSGFGGYKQLLPVVALLNFGAQAVAMLGIAIAIFTGGHNIFSAPEYAFGGDGRTWTHFGAHLVIGATVGSLVLWLAGCVVMFLSGKVLTKGGSPRAAARA